MLTIIYTDLNSSGGGGGSNEFPYPIACVDLGIKMGRDRAETTVV
jgi:hypothetical protein